MNAVWAAAAGGVVIGTGLALAQARRANVAHQPKQQGSDLQDRVRSDAPSKTASN